MLLSRPKDIYVLQTRYVGLQSAMQEMMLNISGVDRGFSGSRDIHCIILYGEFIMSAVNHPPHAADPVTGTEEKS